MFTIILRLYNTGVIQASRPRRSDESRGQAALSVSRGAASCPGTFLRLRQALFFVLGDLPRLLGSFIVSGKHFSSFRGTFFVSQDLFLRFGNLFFVSWGLFFVFRNFLRFVRPFLRLNRTSFTFRGFAMFPRIFPVSFGTFFTSHRNSTSLL